MSRAGVVGVALVLFRRAPSKLAFHFPDLSLTSAFLRARSQDTTVRITVTAGSNRRITSLRFEKLGPVPPQPPSPPQSLWWREAWHPVTGGGQASAGASDEHPRSLLDSSAR